jgi:hypothetical protein
MTDQDLPQFAMLMAGMAEVFSPDKPLTEAFVTLYYNALKEYPVEQVRMAVNKVMRERVFNGMPKPAELINQIIGESEDRALLAWNKVLRAVKRIGPYQSVQFDDACILLVLDSLGGWEKICNTLESELQWYRRDFLSQYKVHQGRTTLLTHLAGITERINGANGFDHKEIYYIGEPDNPIERKLLKHDESANPDQRGTGQITSKRCPPIGDGTK